MDSPTFDTLLYSKSSITIAIFIYNDVPVVPSHNSYVLSLLDSNNKVSKKFWKYIKGMRKDTTSINVLHSNGEDYIY